MATGGSACIRNRGGLDLSHDAGASRSHCEEGIYVCCWCGVVWGVEGGGGLPLRRHSCRGHRVGLWRIPDWLKNDKVKQSRQTRVYLGFTRPNTGTMRSGPMAVLVGCAFELIFECNRVLPQPDQLHLFFAAVLYISTTAVGITKY